MGDKKEKKSDKKKTDKGFFQKIQAEFSEGMHALSSSLDRGLNDTKEKPVLIVKYGILTLAVAFLYVGLMFLLPEMAAYLSYTLFIPVAVLILMFHHELFAIPMKDIKRFALNTLAIAVFFLVIYLLFTYSASQPADTPETPRSPLALVASTAAIFMFVLFLFLPVYMVKSGATPLGAIKNAFRFLSKNAIKGMFYVVLLLLLLSAITTIPSIIGLALVSPIIFVLLSYCLFIFINSFWEHCRNS